jgi:hypothetical protein
MGNTIKVRVNPKAPGEYALMVDPADTYSPWYKQGAVSNGWVSTSRLSDWEEFTLDVPEPTQVFEVGDVVQSIEYPDRRRVRNHLGEWNDVSGQGRVIYDYRVRERMSSNFYGSEGRLKFIGNISTLP